MSRILYKKKRSTQVKEYVKALVFFFFLFFTFDGESRASSSKQNQHTTHKHTQPPQLAPGKRLKTMTWRPLTFGGFFLRLLLVAVVAAGAAVAGYRASSAEDLDRYKRLYTITVSSSSSFFRFFFLSNYNQPLKEKEKFQK